MIRLIRFLITGSWHEHKWEKIQEIEVYQYSSSSRPHYTKFVCKCTDCGVIKKWKV